MNNQISFRRAARRTASLFVVLASLAAFLISSVGTIGAASWNSIEPLKSRRADVERALGRPIQDLPGETGTLRFKVAGGMVTVAFIDAKFIATKKISEDLEGTVKQIVLQHDSASDTPESLGLIGNEKFEREDKQSVSVFRNVKDGVVYTFINGKLKTTYYTPSTDQWARVQTKTK